MKYLLTIIFVFNSHMVSADNSCTKERCDVSLDQKKCVLTNYCHEKALLREIGRLKENLSVLTKAKELSDMENYRLKFRVDELNGDLHYCNESKNDYREEKKSDKNAVSVIGGAAKSGLNVSQSTNNFDAKTTYEGDVGLMYQHDFDNVRGSIEGTVNGTILLGIGLKF